ncbi:MAG: hypothetical protein J6A49_06485 [Clostridia bacterium]|nr:hypothetical protein [Clostridia bacterium]
MLFYTSTLICFEGIFIFVQELQHNVDYVVKMMNMHAEEDENDSKRLKVFY